MIEKIVYKGEDAFKIQSDALSCICIPRRGGKLVSIKHRKKDFELLFQNPKENFSDANIKSRFEDFEACGFDDAFPSIDAENILFNGKLTEYPDHGEIWSAPFESEVNADKITLTYESRIFNYTYIKRIRIDDNRLICAYCIKNVGESSFPCFYAMHCLANIEKGMRLIFPNGTESVINVMDSPRLGKRKTVYSFPKDMINGIEYDFSVVSEQSSEAMEKFYVNGSVKEGKCGFEYVCSGIRAMFEYDPRKLPYLGFWITQGGFRGDYNCALEPTNGFYDSISCAQKNGKCPELEQNEAMEFEISITLEEIEHID